MEISVNGSREPGYDSEIVRPVHSEKSNRIKVVLSEKSRRA